MNGRLYHSLREKAEELQGLHRVQREHPGEHRLRDAGRSTWRARSCAGTGPWSRSTAGSREEVLGRSLDDILPPSFLEALRGSLVLGDTRGDRPHLQAPPPHPGRAQPHGERLGGALPGGLRGALRNRADPRRHHGPGAPGGAAPALGEDGLASASWPRGWPTRSTPPWPASPPTPSSSRGRSTSGTRAARLLDKIEKQSFRAAKIINNLLNFSRAAGAEMEPLDVNKALLDVLSLIEHQLEGSKIRVRRELAPRLPAVRGNENRIQQVFFNLILNARDAMPRGRLADLKTSADDDTVVVEVKRHRGRHQARGHQADLRSLLHHQGDRARHRPRPLRLLRDRPGARGGDLRGQRARQGDDLPGGPPRPRPPAEAASEVR